MIDYTARQAPQLDFLKENPAQGGSDVLYPSRSAQAKQEDRAHHPLPHTKKEGNQPISCAFFEILYKIYSIAALLPTSLMQKLAPVQRSAALALFAALAPPEIAQQAFAPLRALPSSGSALLHR